MKYRKKPIVIEAHRWFRNGDHPEDKVYKFSDAADGYSEGLVVRYYRHPRIDGQIKCSECNHIMHEHGWIDTLEGGYVVCVGDWIIKGVNGEFYPCKPDIFEKTYEPATEE